MCCDCVVFGVVVMLGVELQYCYQIDLVIDCVYYDGVGEVVEFCIEVGFQLSLKIVGVVLGDVFEEGIDEVDDQEGGGELWIEMGVFGDVV